MANIRSYPAEKITPSSILGNKVEIFSRHFYLPFQKIILEDDSCEDILYIYTCDARDNSSAIIKEISDSECLKTEFTNIALESKISGIHITISTQAKVRNRDIKKVNLSGRHKAQQLNLNAFTYVELIKEETNIINSKHYHILLDKKLKKEINTFGLIEIDM